MDPNSFEFVRWAFEQKQKNVLQDNETLFLADISSDPPVQFTQVINLPEGFKNLTELASSPEKSNAFLKQASKDMYPKILEKGPFDCVHCGKLASRLTFTPQAFVEGNFIICIGVSPLCSSPV
eukprot:CAMPEP_0196586214 /NCGR_PEP_ID=MMETSP1081-20130531/53506_1 /TAXON_ID=36882 /ORGANISM="Pyramimonas amylifera, Strain CCMP720" /LENGTH=122 /DNA_ID=CAMNT_0041908013 /DNA_START=90 /DNA_END=454 /DNA_ORIENTATION=-